MVWFSRALLPEGTYRLKRGRAAAVGGLVLLTFSFFGADNLMSLAVTRGLGGSITSAGVALTLGAVAWAVASLVHERVANRWTTRPWLPSTSGVALLLIGLAAIWVGLVTTGVGGASSYWISWPAWLVGGVGMGLLYPTVMLGGLVEGPDMTYGEAAGAVVLAEMIGGTVGTAVGGGAVSLAVSSHLPVTDGLRAAFAIFFCTAVLLGWAIAQSLRASAAPEAG